jgi:hypothetical protein
VEIACWTCRQFKAQDIESGVSWLLARRPALAEGAALLPYVELMGWIAL